MAPPDTTCRLRAPQPADQAEFLALANDSQALHGRWVRPPRSAAEFSAWLARAAEPGHVSWLVCRAGEGGIAGVINLSNIVMGNFRSGYLGYYAMAGQERQGLMRAGLSAAVRQAFSVYRLHRLHRLEANIQPGNLASIALVQACGFHREGLSPRYLKIAGRWRDHERWAIVADSARPTSNP